MPRFLTPLLILAAPALAQEQQAGNAASTDVEGTFRTLVEQCDDVDALMLRARIRLLIPRSTDAAAEQAQTLLEQGLATCGEGDVEGAKATLSEALTVAGAGVDEALAPATPAPAPAPEPEAAAEPEGDRPWWRFW